VTKPVTIQNKNNSVKNILFVNPSKYKGEDIVYELARIFKNLNFILVPLCSEELSIKWDAIPNKNILNPFIKNGDMYKNIDIVLVPTQKAEAFGRVAIEAQSHGIPVIASKHTGLLESLENSSYMIDRYKDIFSWQNALQNMCSNEVERSKIIERGFKNSKKYTTLSVIEKFEKLLESLV